MGEAPESRAANTDEDLVRLVIAGERDLFAPLYERYYWRVFRMAYGMTGNHGSAEDLTQEIFMRTYQRLKDFRGQSAFSTWLYRVGDIAEAVKAGSMPLTSYTLLHPEARLTQAERDLIIEWARAERTRLADGRR